MSEKDQQNKNPKIIPFGVTVGNMANVATLQRNGKVISPWQINIKLIKVKPIVRQQNQLGILPLYPQ